MYTLNMATLQKKTSRGHTYWYVVESRRINGKPRPVVLAYLGKPEDLLARLAGARGRLRLRSVSHGAVAALKGVADQLQVVDVINQALGGHRRRDGLSVGETLLLAALGRVCRPTSKRGWASWAADTSVGKLFAARVDKLDSQHFWDQMEAVPPECLATIEQTLTTHAVQRWGIELESVFYDTTNFFTFIASDNKRSRLARRGHSKQKRHDLRQFGLALLVSRTTRVPLLHEVYEGSRPDVWQFAQVLTRLRQRLEVLTDDVAPITLVYDKGNNSRANQAAVDATPFHYVASLVPASHRALIDQANRDLQDVTLSGGEVVPAWRTRQVLWGTERTLVVIVSQRLREGQLRGLGQHLEKAHRQLAQLREQLDAPRARPRRRDILQRHIDEALKAQFLRHVLHVTLTPRAKGRFRLTVREDAEQLRRLAEEFFGRRILMTDRHDWSSAQIIEAYRGQSQVEATFKDLKNPYHLAVRPVFHWTDQKLRVHAFCCVLGYLLAKLTELLAQRESGWRGSLPALLDQLTRIRQVTVLEMPKGRGRPRVHTQLETLDPELKKLARAFNMTA